MYWLMAAVGLFIIEMFAGTFYLLIVSAAFASTAIASFLFSFSNTINTAIAIFFSIVGIIIVACWQKKFKHKNPNLPANITDFGQQVILQHPLPSNLWQVQYRGTIWEAKLQNSETASSGESAYIVGHQGNTLIITTSTPSTLQGA